MPSLENSELHAFGRQQFGVLLGQRVLRFGEDPQEVVLGQIGKLNADREAPCSSGIRSAGFDA
jgi:hypothetical protein